MIAKDREPLNAVPLGAHEDPALLSPLVLAYLGDTLYDLYVRTRLIRGSHAAAGKLHRMAIRYVCAAGQAASLEAIIGLLSEKEADVVRRGRNAKPGTVPKNASLDDYRHATAFEALLGYLYLAGQEGRAQELMTLAFEKRNGDETHA